MERLAALQRSERRHAPLCAEPHAAERQSGIIRLPAHKGQNAHGSRGEGGGEIRFEAERPHLEIGMHGPLRQPGGDRFVVGCGIVCRDKAAAVRAVTDFIAGIRE